MLPVLWTVPIGCAVGIGKMMMFAIGERERESRAAFGRGGKWNHSSGPSSVVAAVCSFGIQFVLWQVLSPLRASARRKGKTRRRLSVCLRAKAAGDQVDCSLRGWAVVGRNLNGDGLARLGERHVAPPVARPAGRAHRTLGGCPHTRWLCRLARCA